MKALPTLLAIALLLGCSAPAYLYKGTHDGVEISYRWNHPPGKPSELLLKLTNAAVEDKRLDLVIDLYYQGRTVESLQADTCIRSGQTLNGKLNGIYFVPQRVTTEQIKSGDAKVEMTRTGIEPAMCE